MKVYIIDRDSGEIELINQPKYIINLYPNSYYKTFTIAKKELIKSINKKIDSNQNQINHFIWFLVKINKLKKKDIKYIKDCK
jgi:hypothetical protein